MLVLTANVFAATNKSFKRRGALHPNQSLIIGGGTYAYKITCASDCLKRGDECLAFGYSDGTKECRLMSCFNMDALTDGQGDFYTDISLSSTHLLAQG